ncbi:hypothetical protein GBAR_LOCUS27801 [Geodia barretti]|uniref:Uncharacterized protein n=1 Tax=Geodia barretti TaxID=519541 RepID=A0AA35XGK0_GEOBA|nr:hypothetical protein GBAR_LOCUS27801 [Geodia barretti]
MVDKWKGQRASSGALPAALSVERVTVALLFSSLLFLLTGTPICPLSGTFCVYQVPHTELIYPL